MAGLSKIIDRVGGDFDAGGFPEVEGFLVDEGAPHRDKLDAGLLGEFEDVFWGPFRVGVERINNGFPGVDVHNPGKHFGAVDLGNETVEEFFVVFLGGGKEFGELKGDVGLIKIFSIGDDIDVRVFLQELEEGIEVERMILVVPEGRHEIGVGKGGGVGVSSNLHVGITLDNGASSPAIGIMSDNGATIGGNIKIDLKNAVAELVIEQEGFARVGIAIA